MPLWVLCAWFVWEVVLPTYLWMLLMLPVVAVVALPMLLRDYHLYLKKKERLEAQGYGKMVPPYRWADPWQDS